MQTFHQLLEKLNTLRALIFLSEKDRELRYRLRKIPKNLVFEENKKILFQTPEDYFYVVIFSMIKSFFQQSEIHFVDIRMDYGWRSRLGQIRFAPLFYRKWLKLYCDKGGCVDFKLYVAKKDVLDRHHDLAKKIFCNLKCKEDVLSIQISDIEVGDLIYDTYLRYKTSAGLDYRDDFLYNIIVQAAVLIDRSLKYFTTKKIDYFFTSYTSYLHHGIPARVAIRCGTKVVSAGSYDQLFKIIQGPYYSHTKEFRYYKSDFEKQRLNLDDQKIIEAQKSLEDRFQGVIDAQTYYMRESAFHQSATVKPVIENNGRKKAIIFLHCFFDNPHCYGKINYADFYDWITSLLSKANTSKYDYYVKPHPNGLAENAPIIESLRQAYPQVKFISSKVSNNQLIREGFDAGFTVYGTLAHELPYFNIPVVCGGENPHQTFDFSIQTANRTEYENYFANLDLIPKVNENAREEILQFYYMHNYFLYPGCLPFKDNLYLNNELRFLYDNKNLTNFIEKIKNHKYLLGLNEMILESLKSIL